MDTPEDFNKTLQEELDRCKADMQALQSEFNDLAENDDGTLTPDAARKAIIAGAPSAIKQIITLSTMGDSDSVRLNASKYIVDVSLGKVQIGDPAENSFKQFLEGLKKPATPGNIAKVKENAQNMAKKKAEGTDA